MKGTRSSGWNAIFAEHSPESSGPDNEKKRTPKAFWQASACSVRVMHAVCAESRLKKSQRTKRRKNGAREKEKEYLSVVKQAGSIVPELIRA